MNMTKLDYIQDCCNYFGFTLLDAFPAGDGLYTVKCGQVSFTGSYTEMLAFFIGFNAQNILHKFDHKVETER